MIERPHDKSHDCGRAFSEVERGTWNELLNAFQIQDYFSHEGGPRFSWTNDQSCNSRRLARLDKFYTPNQSRLGFHHNAYYIHGYSVGSDHSTVQIEINIGSRDVRTSKFKWKVIHLKSEISDFLSDKWAGLPTQTSFFSKLRIISRIYRQASKRKAREIMKLDLTPKQARNSYG